MTPELSIIMSCGKNRFKHFKIAIKSILEQSFPAKSVELLFLNEGGSKKNLNILLKYKQKLKIRYFTVHSSKNVVSQVAASRNFLARKARGKYLLITDPEIFHFPNSIKHLLQSLNRSDENIWYCGPVYGTKSFVNKSGKLTNLEVPGPIKNELDIVDKSLKLNTNQVTNYLTELSRRKVFNYTKIKHYKSLMFCTAVSRKVFLSVRGFNENLQVWGYDDPDLFNRLIPRGVKLIFDKKFITYHLPHQTTISLEKRLSWNLFNSSLDFKNTKSWGNLTGKKVSETLLR